MLIFGPVSIRSRDKKIMINGNIKHGELFSKDRDYKVGDVLRWVPNNANWEKVEDKGLAVVIKASGPLFTVFWLGDESISEHDARWEGFKLQDLAALPQVVEYAHKTIQREYI
jgi:hypothetical protein